MAVVDRRFDVVWFGGRPNMVQSHFEALLRGQAGPGRGHFVVMPTTARLSEVRDAGNRLGHYDTSLSRAQRAAKGQQGAWRSTPAEVMADRIAEAHERGGPGSGNHPPFPTKWIFLNELSRRLWLTEQSYRDWIVDLADDLATRGYKVVVFSPLTKAGAVARGSAIAGDWRRLAAHAFIAIEGYLGGQVVVSQGERGVAWCTEQYRAMKDAYVKLDIPAARLFLTEHFAQTAGTGPGPRGRWGISPGDWVETIRARCEAAGSVRFSGYVTYAWMYNQMQASEAELIRFTDAYVEAAGRNRLGFHA